MIEYLNDLLISIVKVKTIIQCLCSFVTEEGLHDFYSTGVVAPFVCLTVLLKKWFSTCRL